MGGGVELLVAQEDLDHSDIDLLLQAGGWQNNAAAYASETRLSISAASLAPWKIAAQLAGGQRG